MPDYHLLTELVGLPHVQVTHYQLVGGERLNLFVASTLPAAICPDCQPVSLAVHETGEPHFLRARSLWQRRCWLGYAPRRFKCTSCSDTFVERVVWREPGLGYTQRYEQSLYERMRREPVAHVARSEGRTEEAAQGIFERWAKKVSFGAATRA